MDGKAEGAGIAMAGRLASMAVKDEILRSIGLEGGAAAGG
jgi:hypothetical protein